MWLNDDLLNWGQSSLYRRRMIICVLLRYHTPHIYPIPCVSHSLRGSLSIPFHVCPTSCVSHSLFVSLCTYSLYIPLRMILPRVVISVHVTLPVRPNLCLSHSLIIQLRVYPAHVSLTTCVFHSACVLPRVFSLRACPTTCVYDSVYIPLRVYFALRVFHCECGGVPCRMCSTPCVCSTPFVFHFVCDPFRVCSISCVFCSVCSTPHSIPLLCPTPYSCCKKRMRLVE